VSYNQKHNEANGEDNRDGHDHNISWNYGVEGPTDDPEILRLRRLQARNFIAILMLSQGVPMLLSGDELLRTKHGNNNSYCQDNPISWIDWGNLRDNRPMFDFVCGLIRLRRRHPTLTRSRFLTGKPEPGQTMPDISWHGAALNRPSWDDPKGRSLAFTLAGTTMEEPPLHVMFNMWEHDLEFALPEVSKRRWHLAVNTAAEPGVIEREAQAAVPRRRVKVAGRSVMVLEGHSG